MGSQIKTGAWDPEEDDLLYYWQSKVGNKWSEVAKHIPGRTGQQCAQRWRHKVNPNIRRDKWTAEEDAKLIELVKTFGVGRWAEIARNCDGRTDQQCMGRWRRHLDPSIRRDSWSAEEDTKLRQLHAQYGTSWSRISKNLKGRTSQQCRARWHQINNSRSKSCGSGGAGALLAAAAGGGSSAGSGRQASGRKAPASKRKPSRRRQDSSCSEEEEEEEVDDDDACEGDEEEEGGPEAEEGGSSRALSGSGSGSGGSQPYGEDQQQQEYAAAVAAATAAAGFGYGSAEMQQPWVASLAAGMIHGALSSASDSAAHAAAQQDQQRQGPGSGDSADEAADEDDQDPEEGEEEEEDAPAHQHGRSRAGLLSSPLGRYKSLPSKLGGRAAAAAAAGRGLRHTGSMPVGRRAPSSSCLSPNPLWPSGQHQQQTWSPSRLLLSPQQPQRMVGRGRAAAAAADMGKDVNDAEAEGAETLLEMASLLQQESCELQPAQLPPLPAYTLPKRPAGDRLEEEGLQDGLSPSPYKRARSSRLFADDDHAADGYQPSEYGGGLGGSSQRRRAAEASGELLEADDPGPQPSPAAARAAAAAGPSHRRNGSSFRHYRVPQAKAAAAAAAAADEAGDAFDGPAAGGAQPGPQDSYGGGFLGDLGFRAPGIGLHPEQADDAGRPSNASCLTGLRGQDAMAAAAAAAAAALMSPPRPVRGGRAAAPGSATTTPSRHGAQQHVMNLLGSPMFERMVGCATPPSAGRTQPSAATLAALQSPQPSRVPEPFWTPFTGLFQDALFTRGTSATPDLPSAGKPRLPRGLFSPANQRSGTGSGGKVVPRRSLLHAGDSPMGAAAPDTDDDRLGSQPSGGSADPQSLADAETGPSPAAACGVPPSGGQAHHRVVRRLDQHEAWGGTRASPSKHAHPGDSSTKREGLAGSGTGFSLFSPVKKQRVPLFNDASSIKVGATPSKPDVPESDQLLPIAPLKHNLPEPSCSCSQQQQQQQQGSPQDRLVAAAASSFLHGRSPLGVKTRHMGPAGPEPQPFAAAAAAEQQDPQGGHSQQPLQQQQDPQGAAAGPAQGGQLHGAGLGVDDGQEVLASPPALERAGSINHRPMVYDEPDTPVNVADTADNTSCSGTPNTPAGMRADATGGAGQMLSPNEYVTPPQHRLRASRPLAPLHKDCLIAAATRSLADGLAQQQQRKQKQPSAAAAGGRARASASASAAAAAGGAGDDSPGHCSGDSSRVLSCERLMDSPLEAGVLTHASPSQWHQGMVAMLRSLQQTPLQPKAAAAEQQGPTASAAPAAAAGSSPAAGAAGAVSSSPMVGIKVCSRALRRLQDELEQGSAATAAAAAALMAKQKQQQQQHGEQRVAKQEQQQEGPGKDGDAQVPFSAGMSLAAAASGAGGAGASCSTPMMLPLFTVPASSARLPAKGPPGAAAAARHSTMPLVQAPQCSSGVASVSLTPAVVTLHTPAGSAAASAATHSMPAMAWPVQQRSDGGLVVSAPMTGTAAAAAAATAASGALVQLTPAASTTKAGPAAAAAATPFPAVGAAAAGGQQWPQAGPLPVVSIQPLTLLASACNAAVAAGQAAALQSVLALQPGTAPATASGAAASMLPEQLCTAGLPGASPAAAAALRDSSHAVRSRLHALIDSV